MSAVDNWDISPDVRLEELILLLNKSVLLVTKLKDVWVLNIFTVLWTAYNVADPGEDEISEYVWIMTDVIFTI